MRSGAQRCAAPRSAAQRCAAARSGAQRCAAHQRRAPLRTVAQRYALRGRRCRDRAPQAALQRYAGRMAARLEWLVDHVRHSEGRPLRERQRARDETYHGRLIVVCRALAFTVGAASGTRRIKRSWQGCRMRVVVGQSLGRCFPDGGQTRSNSRHTSLNWGARMVKHGPFWANLGQYLARVGQCWPSLGRISAPGAYVRQLPGTCSATVVQSRSSAGSPKSLSAMRGGQVSALVG